MCKDQFVSRISFLRNLIKETEERDGGNMFCFDLYEELWNLEEVLAEIIEEVK